MTESRSPNKPSPGGRGQFQIRRTIIRTKALREEDDREENRKRALNNPNSKPHKAPPAQNIFKQQKELPTPQPPQPVQHLTDQMIKSSKMYRMMEEQIASAIARHAEEMESLHNILNSQNRESETLSKQSHALKIKMWDLRNEILKLEGQLGQENQQHNYLSEMAGGQGATSYPSNEPSEPSELQSSEPEIERMNTYQAEQSKQEEEDYNEMLQSESDTPSEGRLYSSYYELNRR